MVGSPLTAPLISLTNTAPLMLNGTEVVGNVVNTLAVNDGTAIPAGGITVANIGIADPDGIITPTRVFSLAGADAAAFQIVGTQLRFIGGPAGGTTNYEAKPVYHVTVNVADGTQGGSGVNYTLNITDLNDNRAQITSGVRLNVQENTPTNVVVYRVAATDLDSVGPALVYSLVGGVGGEDNGLFNMTAINGEIHFNLSPNFETPTDANGDGVYNILVGVDDNGAVAGGLTTKAVQITVTDFVEGGNVIVGTGVGEAINAGATPPGQPFPTTAGDTIDGGGGNDTMNGGDGDDVYVVDTTADQIIEALNGGLDTVVAFANYTLPANVEVLSGFPSPVGLLLTGNGSGNMIFGSLTGNDTLIGGGGNDVLSAFGGTNVMQGGVGDDTYYSGTLGDSITEAPGEGFDVLVVSYDMTLPTNIEVLVPTGAATSAIGTAGNDIIYGANVSAAGLNIDGLGGNDTLYGTALNDTLTGGLGNDNMLGFGGTNTFNGGAGDDTYNTDSATDILTGAEAPGGGTDIVVASYNTTLLNDFEILVLVGAATSGTGNADSNVITASPLAHGATLNGAGGADNMFGSAFVDILNGGAGADNDVMFGGGGADTFQFNAANFGTDTINDFVTTAVSVGNHDLINLQGTGVANFAALNISYSVAGATIDTGVGTIFLTGITVGLQNSDFVF